VFWSLAHKVFCNAGDLDCVILPISFDESREALAENLETRKTALDYLASGGAIDIFPGGTVSTSAKPFLERLDPVWQSFTAKMIAKSNATVVPIYFEGANSRLLLIASLIHTNVRAALLIKEFRRRTDEPVKVVIGKTMAAEEITAKCGDAKAMMDFLRASTYALSPEGTRTEGYRFEFEASQKKARGDGCRYTG